MSKSLNNLFIPALGGIALIVGGAYGLASRDYGEDRIAALEARVEQVTARLDEAEDHAATSAEEAAALGVKLEEAMAVRGSGGTLTGPAPANEARLGLGRSAHAEEIAAWDVDVLPDGRGLPEGRGDVFTGEEVFAEHCASCHGDFAEGVDNWPVLAGGFDTLADKDPVKTVGSYWPYLSTVWDYVHRSMPFGSAQTMSDDDVYAIVAYILYSNDLVDEDFELSRENFAEVQMYNAEGFILDDRAEMEYPHWQSEPCMEGCKDSAEITMRASVLDVTPAEEGAEAPVTPAATEEASATTEDPAEEAAINPELAKAGEAVFRKCKSCHQVGDGATNKIGPHLNGVFGRVIGGMEGFKFSKGFQAAAEEGRVWDEAAMADFLTKPKAYIKGTRMSFAGLKKAEDIEALTAYLKSQGQ